MSREAPQLDRIEHWMYSVITHPNGAEAGIQVNLTQDNKQALKLEQTVLPSDELTSLERISIYANMYFWRLNEVMSNEYPAVCHVLGEELFNNVVKDYITYHPSTYYNLNHLSNKFPIYLLTEAKGIPHQKFVAAVASVERAMEDVFDERHIERIPIETLQSIPDEKWADIRFQFNPALRLLELDYPVNEYMTAVRQDRHMDIPQPEKSFVVVYRCNFKVWRKDLDQDRFQLLSRLKDGETLGAALEACILLPDVNIDKLTSDLGEWFKEWSTEEFFCSINT